MALLRTLGVDGAGEGLEVTASTGPRPRGLQGEGQAALTLSARAPSLSGALLALQGVSESYVFFGYVDQLLLGEELARQGIEPVLEFFARDVELSLGTQLWLVRGDTAGAGVRSARVLILTCRHCQGRENFSGLCPRNFSALFLDKTGV